jgi:hypothetical protein
MKAVFWGVLFLFFALMIWSIVAVQFIHPLNKTLEYENCDRCPRAYSTVMQSLLTLSQQIICGDSWGQATIPLIEAYPATAIYFAAVFITIGLATMNLILGVVVSVAQEAHDGLCAERKDLERMNRMEVKNHLMEMCIELDHDKSGELTKDELLMGYDRSESFRAAFDEMEVQKEDLEIVWGILDSDHNGTVSYGEFVKEIYKLRDSDSTYMLAYIKYYITVLKTKLLEVMERQANEQLSELKHIEDIEKMEMQKIDHMEEELEARHQEIQQVPNRLVNTSVQSSRDNTLDDVADQSMGYAAACGDRSKGLHKELDHTLRDLRRRLDLYASNTSQLLMGLLRQQEHIDLLAVPPEVVPSKRSGGSSPKTPIANLALLTSTPWETPEQPKVLGAKC